MQSFGTDPTGNLLNARVLGVLVSAILTLCTAIAQENGKAIALEDIGDYRDAIQAVKDHLPEVAARKFEKVLSEATLTGDDRSTLEIRLIEALVRSGRHDAVLERTKPGTRTPPAFLFWRAISLSKTGEYTKASETLARLGENPEAAAPFYPEAILNRVAILRKLDAPGEALRVLERYMESPPTDEGRVRLLLQIAELQSALNRFDEADETLARIAGPAPIEKSELRYLQARVATGQQRWEDAIAGFKGLIDAEEGEPVPPKMRHAAVIGLADACIGSHQTEKAGQVVAEYIDANPTLPDLIPFFERLEATGTFATSEISKPLLKWSRSEHAGLAAVATFYLGVAQIAAVDRKTAIETLHAFRSSHPDHALGSRALLRLSELHTENGDREKALSAISALKTHPDPAVAARVAFLEARADFAAEKFKEAADKFARAGAGAEGSFNAALAALKAREAEDSEIIAAELGQPLEGELLLERGLYAAARKDTPSAIPLLAHFLANHGEHPRAAEARLALASLYLLEVPARTRSAREQLDAVLASPDVSEAWKEEAEYVAVWIDESAYNEEAMLEKAKTFVEKWPASPHAPEIQMKIAEVYLRQQQDFASAQAAFEAVADRYPQSPYVAPALFFAGKAAMRINTENSREKAIDLWGRLYELKGPLSLEARHHQALVKRMQKKDAEAIALFESVLSADPEGELLYATLAAKGEALMVGAEPDAAGMKEAISVFESALALEDLPASWRYQMLFRLGKCYEKAGNADKALEVWYDCLNSERDNAQPMAPDEYDWYFRAGDAAWLMLVERKNDPNAVKAAIAIASRLGKIPGPRAQVALERARKLELEHFIWEETP